MFDCSSAVTVILKYVLLISLGLLYSSYSLDSSSSCNTGYNHHIHTNWTFLSHCSCTSVNTRSLADLFSKIIPNYKVNLTYNRLAVCANFCMYQICNCIQVMCINRLKAASITDSRVKVMNEVITGIRVIKMYAWEHAFKKMVDEIRK